VPLQGQLDGALSVTMMAFLLHAHQLRRPVRLKYFGESAKMRAIQLIFVVIPTIWEYFHLDIFIYKLFQLRETFRVLRMLIIVYLN